MGELDRIAFKTSRLLDYCSRKELIAQTGHGEADWPLVVVKELVDNALDACEEVGIEPDIRIVVTDDSIEVTDNEQGLPPTTLDGTLDFSVRISDREAYVAPDRGAQGNALKTIIAMPYVLDGTEGIVEIAAHGQREIITVSADRIRQEPVIRRASHASDVRNGTSITLRWPSSACSTLLDSRERLQLATAYTVLNPHLRLTVDWLGEPIIAEDSTDPGWSKWTPSDPTSPHWYRPDHLERLVAAYLAHDADQGRERTVREFICEFRGLSGTAKQKAVLDATGLSRAPLSALAMDDNVDHDAVVGLLAAMKAQSRPVKPPSLGIIGRDHLRTRLEVLGVELDSFDYRKVIGFTADDDAVPYVVETAFGWLGDEADDSRRLVSGVNWSPGIVNPFRSLGKAGRSMDAVLQEQRAGRAEPVVLVLHMAMPRVEFTDRGKSAVVIS